MNKTPAQGFKLSRKGGVLYPNWFAMRVSLAPYPQTSHLDHSSPSKRSAKSPGTSGESFRTCLTPLAYLSTDFELSALESRQRREMASQLPLSATYWIRVDSIVFL